MQESFSLISTLAIGFGMALVLGFIAEKIKVPALVGYLLAGILVSPYFLGFHVDRELASQLADIGIMLLMFGVGLHFSISDLLKVKALVVPGVLCQMSISMLLGTALSSLWGWPLGQCLIIGMCLSCASTVVVLKALEARGLLESFDGRVAVGWLVVQDMVTVILLVLLPPLSVMLGGNVANPQTDPLWQLILETLGRVILFIVLMLVVGKRLFPWLLWQVAKTGSRELFTLCVLAVAIGIAYGASEIFKVSFALGAFFAGMVMRESQYAHRAAVESLPLRDAFSVIFFVGVGMMFNPMVIVDHPLHLLGVLVLILIINPAVSACLVLFFRYPLHTALNLGACLGQIGEFSFILGTLALSLGLLNEEGLNLVLATAIITIALNPFAFASISKATAFLVKKSKIARVAAARPDPQSTMPDEVEKKGITHHIVVIGYGALGSKVAAGLKRVGIPFVVVDKDDAIVTELRDNEMTAIQGDATDPGVLLQAHVQNSLIAVLTLRDDILERKIIETAKQINPGIEFIIRAVGDEEAAHLKEEKLGTVIQASEALSAEVLNQIGKLTLETGSVQDKEILRDYLKKLANQTDQKAEN